MNTPDDYLYAYYIEVRDHCDRVGVPKLISIEGLENKDHNTNFRSTYMFDGKVAGSIQENGHTRGLKGKSVASNVLFIDVDEDENVDKVETILRLMVTRYGRYTTGNRGKHFHIPIEWMEGTNVIYSQIKWLKSVGLWELIDHSIYREGGQYRRVGAIHAKTGKRKEHEITYKTLDSTPLQIPTLVAPPEVVEPFSVAEGDSTNMQIFLMNCMQKRNEGGRHSHMYILWQSGKAAGLDKETITEMTLWWNYQQDTPHRSSVVEDKLRRFR